MYLGKKRGPFTLNCPRFTLIQQQVVFRTLHTWNWVNWHTKIDKIKIQQLIWMLAFNISQKEERKDRSACRTFTEGGRLSSGFCCSAPAFASSATEEDWAPLDAARLKTRLEGVRTFVERTRESLNNKIPFLHTFLNIVLLFVLRWKLMTKFRPSHSQSRLHVTSLRCKQKASTTRKRFDTLCRESKSPSRHWITDKENRYPDTYKI